MSDLISRADAIEAVQTYLNILINSRRHGDDFTFINVLTEIRNKISELPSAELPNGDMISRADAMAYIDRVINSGLGRNKSLDYIHKYISALPSADAVQIHNDGTLEVKVPNAHKVGRVLVMDTDSHIGGGLFYPDDAVQGEWLEIEDYNGDYHYQCSVCKDEFYLEYGTPKENGYAYCPSCGARMYKEDGEE